MNRSIGCSSARTFRLKSYSKKRLLETMAGNLECLERILAYNRETGLLFFRISSDLVPFASHPVCRVDWASHFGGELRRLGRLIRKDHMRISMHPDQFTLINSPDRRIFKRSLRELEYHARVLDRMNMDVSAKIQIHVGGVYGDKPASMRRFVDRFCKLSKAVRRRLVIENDDRLYSVADCMNISRDTGLPVLLDTFHHSLNNQKERLPEVLAQTSSTWSQADGLPMLDYSSQARGRRPGSHAESVDLRNFRRFLESSRPFDFDLMLEIKDKEKSAKRVLRSLAKDDRLVTSPSRGAATRRW